MDADAFIQVFNRIFGSGADGSIAWWQMCARAVLISIYAIFLLHLSARRTLGNGTVMDIVVAVVIGSALSRALTGNALLLPTLAATAVLIALHSLIAAVAVRANWFSLAVKGRSTRLVERGKVDWRKANRALIGEHDLDEELCLQGVSGVENVEAAHLERNGKISVVRRPASDR